jgi:hypothetical protein
MKRKQPNAPFVVIVGKVGKSSYIITNKKGTTQETIAASELYRKQSPILKEQVKQYIKDSAHRHVQSSFLLQS